MEITLDDLIEKCEECDGTGERKEPLPQRGRQTFGSTLVGSFPSATSCQRCAGTGRTELTKTGEAIKEFLGILKKRQW